jgi:hypothetical protein
MTAAASSGWAAEPASARATVVLRFEGAGADEPRRFTRALQSELHGIASVDVLDPAAVVIVSVTWTAKGAVLLFEDASGARVAPPRSVQGETPDVVASEAAAIVRATVIAMRERAALTRRDDPAVASTAPTAPPPPPERAPAAVVVTAPSAPREPTGAPPPASPANEAPAARARDSRVALGVVYAGSVYAPAIPWRSGLRAEARAALLHVGAAWVYGGLAYGFDPPIDVMAANVTLRTSRHDATVVAGVAGRVGPWSGAGEVGPILADTIQSDPATASGVTSTGDHDIVSAGLVARLRAGLAIAARSHLDLSAGVAAYPAGEAYVVQGAGRTTVLAPYRIQPEGSLGLSFDVW